MNASPSKGWRRDEYRQRTGAQRITAIEITPEGDARPHQSREGCECIPRLEYENGVAILIHNAFDGREASENDHKEPVTKQRPKVLFPLSRTQTPRKQIRAAVLHVMAERNKERGQ